MVAVQPQPPQLPQLLPWRVLPRVALEVGEVRATMTSSLPRRTQPRPSPPQALSLHLLPRLLVQGALAVPEVKAGSATTSARWWKRTVPGSALQRALGAREAHGVVAVQPQPPQLPQPLPWRVLPRVALEVGQVRVRGLSRASHTSHSSRATARNLPSSASVDRRRSPQTPPCGSTEKKSAQRSERPPKPPSKETT